MKVKVPAMTDVIQEVSGYLVVPEIRVWCHPHYTRKDGDEYYQVFNGFQEALNFIKRHKEAEDVPLIAFRGYELSIFGMYPDRITTEIGLQLAKLTKYGATIEELIKCYAEQF